MRRTLLLILVGLLACAAAWARVTATTVSVFSTGTTPPPAQIKQFAPLSAGSAPAVDTVYTWEGAINAFADDKLATIGAGLDTTLVTEIHVLYRAATAIGVADVFADLNVGYVQTRLTEGPNMVVLNGTCTVASATDAKVNICYETVGGVGYVQIVNRLGSPIGVLWSIKQGGQVQ